MARRRMGFGRKIKDEPVKTKTNRGRRPERRQARRPAGEMGPPMPMPAAPKPPKADTPKVDMNPTAPKVDAKVTPKPQQPQVTKRPQVTGKGGRNVTREGPMGKRTLANVTREQLTDTGMTLRQYLNYMDKNDGKRPPKKKEPKKVKRTGSARPMSERKFAGGGMKTKMGTKGGMSGGKKKMAPGMKGGGMTSKMSTKGGAMGGKKKMAPGMKKGGKFPDLTGDGKVTKKDVLKGRGVPGFKKGGMKPKGAAAGGGYKKGGMKPKGAAAGGGYKKGGMKTKTATKKRVSKPKVRGAGIARKGVRPVKFR